MHKRLLLIAFCVAIVAECVAQDFMVTKSKFAYFIDGNSVREGSTISADKLVTIRKKGYLGIEYKERWYIYLKPGTYSLDSVFRAEMSNPVFIRNDSIYSILENKGLSNCSFNYRFQEKLEGAVMGTVVVDNIKTENIILNAPQDTVTLKWKNPVAYTGNYYVVIYNMFEDMLDMYVTEKEQVMVQLKRYPDLNALLFKIIAEDCRDNYNHNMIKIALKK